MKHKLLCILAGTLIFLISFYSFAWLISGIPECEWREEKICE